jgi:hypothetical protein
MTKGVKTGRVTKGKGKGKANKFGSLANDEGEDSEVEDKKIKVEVPTEL